MIPYVVRARSVASCALLAWATLGLAPPRAPLSVAEARRYMVTLVNRDRASAGLAPVELDEGAPTRAGQAHAEDMAAHAYVGHYGTDGSVPEQRFTRAGGADMVMENASCYSDARPRTLDRAPLIDPRGVEEAEDAFFHEQPPNDGHRKNILKPWHNKIGIGVAQPVATVTEVAVACFAQEFVDSYGSYSPVPATASVGATVRVAGTVVSPAAFAGVGVARVDAPVRLDVSVLNRRRSYAIPAPYQMYWPAGYVTPIPVRVTAAGGFEIDVPVSNRKKAGMYELSVWANVPGSSEPVMIGLRTLNAL